MGGWPLYFLIHSHPAPFIPTFNPKTHFKLSFLLIFVELSCIPVAPQFIWERVSLSFHPSTPPPLIVVCPYTPMQPPSILSLYNYVNVMFVFIGRCHSTLAAALSQLGSICPMLQAGHYGIWPGSNQFVKKAHLTLNLQTITIRINTEIFYMSYASFTHIAQRFNWFKIPKPQNQARKVGKKKHFFAAFFLDLFLVFLNGELVCVCVHSHQTRFHGIVNPLSKCLTTTLRTQK